MVHVSLKKRIHILGVCGKFMSGLAILANRLGYQVIGYDKAFLPPMSLQLKAEGVTCIGAWECDYIRSQDTVIVGNACRYDNPVVVAARRLGASLVSAPAWLSECVLEGKKVIAIVGTHGKTTTSSWCVEILRRLGIQAGYLIGGVPSGSVFSASLGDSDYFVLEADEYDSAFFDKRPKFLHFWPHYLLINNLEWDHLDIYPSFESMKDQYHYLMRTVHPDGIVVGESRAVAELGLERAATFSLQDDKAAISGQYHQGQLRIHSDIAFNIWGSHYAHNVLGLYALLTKMGFELSASILQDLPLPIRRLQYKGMLSDVHWYDDFAHHATAIDSTYKTLCERYDNVAMVICPTTISQRSQWGLEELKKVMGHVKQVGILSHPKLLWSPEELPDTWVYLENESAILPWIESLAPAAALSMGAVYLEDFYLDLARRGLTIS